MTYPSISVVVPIHNKADHLPRFFDRLEAQDLQHAEVILVDDGSTDDGPTLARRWCDDGQGRRFLHQENRGPSAARNAGAHASTSPAVTFIDADDWPLDGWLSGFVHWLGAGAGMVICRATLEGDGGVRPATKAHHGMAGTFAVQRSVFDAVGGYDEDLWFGENTDLFARVARQCERMALPVVTDPSDRLRLYEDGDRREYDAKRLAAAQHVLRRDAEELEARPSERAKVCAIGAVAAVRTGDIPLARRLAVAAVRAEPRRPKHWIRLLMVLVPPVRRSRWPSTTDRRRVERPGRAG